MNALNKRLQTGLKSLIRFGPDVATLSDGSTVRGILEAMDAEEAAMAFQGAMNTVAPKAYTFQTTKPVPVGYRTVTIDGADYNVAKCMPGQGCYITTLTLKETK